MPKRLGWVDYAKGIGIFLVVLGHTLRGLVTSSILDSAAVQAVDQWIYAFHMPLFFFLSGLFIHRSSGKPFKTFLVEKLQVIAYPYIVWSVLQEVFRVASGRNIGLVVDLWRIVYQPVMQFWFLYVLLLMSIGYAVFQKFRISAKAFLLFLPCFTLPMCWVSILVPGELCILSGLIFFTLQLAQSLVKVSCWQSWTRLKH